MTDPRIEALKTEIINRVKAIEAQKAEKKEVASSYNETIKALEAEKKTLLLELEDAQRAILVEEADEILAEHADVDSEDLSLIE